MFVDATKKLCVVLSPVPDKSDSGWTFPCGNFEVFNAEFRATLASSLLVAKTLKRPPQERLAAIAQPLQALLDQWVRSGRLIVELPDASLN